MSLINQMLKDIDKRQGPAQSTSKLDQSIRGVKSQGGRKGASLVLVLVSVAAIGALLYGYRSLKQPPPSLVANPVVVAVPQAGPAASAAPAASTGPAAPAASTGPAASAGPAAPDTPAALVPQPKNEPVMAAAPASPSAKTAVGSGQVRNQDRLPNLPPEPVEIAKVISPAQKSERLFQQAQQWMAQGRLRESKEALASAVKELALNHEARNLLAKLHIESGEFADAERLLREGRGLSPERKDLAITFAHLHLRSDNIDNAIGVLKSALVFQSQDAELNAFIGSLYQRRNLHEEARIAYVTALRQNPNNPNWLVGLAASLQAQGADQAALEAYQRAIEIGGMSPALLSFAQQRVDQMRK